MSHQSQIIASDPTAIVKRDDLRTALERMKLVVDKRNTIPILSNVMLSADAGSMLLTATDLDMEIRIRIEGEVDGRVATTLPADLLHQMTVKAPKCERAAITLLPGQPAQRPVIVDDQHQRDDDGQLMYEDVPSNHFVSNHTTLAMGKTIYKLNSLPVDDFPEILGKFKGKTTKFDLPGSSLWNAIDAVRAAMSAEETRYYLNGIYFFRHEYGDPVLRAVATDGHRCYVQEMLAPEASEGMPGVIIPRKMCNALHTLLKGKACPRKVRIEIGTNAGDIMMVRMSFGDITVTSKLVDGTFPDYVRVIPTGNSKVATIDAAAMLAAIDAVSVVSSERGRAVRLTFEENQVLLSVNNPDSGTAQTVVASDHDFDPMEIGFNASYLQSAITDACPCPGDDVVFRLADAGSPTLILGSLHGWLGVLMPMRV